MPDTKPFYFKQFHIHQDKVPMKVGTDGVLVGAWADVLHKKSALDIGTGSGVIAIMLAQRMGTEADIHAIDVDDFAIQQAQENFNHSPWPSRFVIHHQSIQSYAVESTIKFDLIISNPPFFTGGMLSDQNHRNEVRHTIKLPHGDLLLAVDKLLSPLGSLAIILPYLQGLRFIEISALYRLYPRRITEVKSRSEKSIERLLIEFGRTPSIPVQNELVIHSIDNQFSDAYKELTQDFYLNF